MIGAPDLVVEILSKSTAVYDKGANFRICRPEIPFRPDAGQASSLKKWKNIFSTRQILNPRNIEISYSCAMKRRDLLRGIGLSSLGLVGLSPQIRAAEILDPLSPATAPPGEKKDPKFEQFGRTEYEKERDKKLFAEQFFNKTELATITVLVDIIIPRDLLSGSASDAGVPAFIEFMAKDKPELQTSLRGGLVWLDTQSKRRFEKKFVDISDGQRLQIVEDIAYPERKKPGLSQGVAFFSLMRNLTASGFWSSQIGINDLGYVGNVPNQWDGPPADVVRQYGLEGWE